jgi:SAM-dependent methyltransferase
MSQETLQYRTHWDKAYQDRETEELGWYESDPQPSLDLILRLDLAKDARQLHVGVGASTLIDRLIAEGYTAVTATDISAQALERLKERLGEHQDTVEWIVDDLIHPQKLQDIKPVTLWHDRAVLHFFTEQKDREAYVDLMKQVIEPGGYAIIATFNKIGAKVCSGLPVHRYDAEELDALTGEDFRLMETFDFTFVNPRGEDRPYVYALFQRVKN